MKNLLSTILLILAFSTLSFCQDYKVIVNSANTLSSISKKDAISFFLKKKSKWSTGDKVVVVDLGSKSSTRASFSKNILGKSTAQVRAYWQQSVFAGGATPPRELKTDAEVIAFVKSNKGAIGYVSSGANISGVKTITIE